MRAIIRKLALNGMIRCQRGATAVEYALILAMIVLAMLGALNVLAGKTIGMWNNVVTEVLAH